MAEVVEVTVFECLKCGERYDELEEAKNCCK